MTAVWSVAQHRRCVADLATSLPYLYEVLGGKADTIDVKHQHHTLFADKSAEAHKLKGVFTEIDKSNRRESHDCRLYSRNKFCKNYFSIA